MRRYTVQESQEERQRIADDPPDILLTNFMMAELLLTRQDSRDTNGHSGSTKPSFSMCVNQYSLAKLVCSASNACQ